MDDLTLRLVAAVREDRLVGRGSCSEIDECYSDEELGEMLVAHGAEDEESAVRIARDSQEDFLEEGLNQRWGEDDDPQLVEYNEFRAARAEAGS